MGVDWRGEVNGNHRLRTNESFLRRTHFAVAWHIFRDQLPEVVLECRFLRHVGRAGDE